MLARDKVLDIIKRTYAAREAGDKEALRDLWAPGSTYSFCGEAELLARMPVAPTAAGAAVESLIDLFVASDLELTDTLVDGNRAVVVWRASFKTGNGPPRKMEVLSLWEFDDDGRAVSVRDFGDTATIAAMLE